MSYDLTPVLAYLKSWGQYDAYDRVVAARDRIDADASTIAALEAELDRVREALRSVIDMDEHGEWHGGVMSQARAALADLEPPCPRCGGSSQVTMHPNALHRYAVRDVYGEPWGDREVEPCPDCTEKET